MAQKGNYAFIDSQNLNLGVRSEGWKIDYRRLRLYLRNKYGVEKAFMFIGRVEGNQALYTALQEAGFILIFKPTVVYFEDGKKTMKGNVDAELVLYAAAKLYNEYNKAIVISGDGDFYCLAEYLVDNNKLLRIMTPNSKYSKLLRSYSQYITQIGTLRDKLEYNRSNSTKKSAHTVGRNLRQSRYKSGSSGRSKP